MKKKLINIKYFLKISIILLLILSFVFKINSIDNVYANIRTNDKVRVAIIDTGSNVADEYYTVIDEDVIDYNGHGTSMAQIIKKEADPYIISIKAFNKEGKGQYEDVYNAFKLADSLNVDYILMSESIKNTGNYNELISLIKDTKATVIASAGNNNTDASNYLPAGIDKVVTVGALDQNGSKNKYSNFGKSVDYYVNADSTSEAAANVLGLIINGKNSSIKKYDYYLVSDEVPTENKELNNKSTNSFVINQKGDTNVTIKRQNHYVLTDYFSNPPSGEFGIYSDEETTDTYHLDAKYLVYCVDNDLSWPDFSGLSYTRTSTSTSSNDRKRLAIASATGPDGNLYTYACNWWKNNSSGVISSSLASESCSSINWEFTMYVISHFTMDRIQHGSWNARTPSYGNAAWDNFYNWIDGLRTGSALSDGRVLDTTTYWLELYEYGESGYQRFVRGGVDTMVPHAKIKINKLISIPTDTDDLYEAEFGVYLNNTCTTKFTYGYAFPMEATNGSSSSVTISNLELNTTYYVSETALRKVTLPSEISYGTITTGSGLISPGTTEKCFYETGVSRPSCIDYYFRLTGSSQYRFTTDTNTYFAPIGENVLGTEFNPDSSCIPVTTGGNNTTRSITITNSPTVQPEYCYSIKKVDDANNPVSGAQWTMTNQSDSTDVHTETTGTNGVATFTGLKNANYTLRETSAPNGYWNDNSSNVTVSSSDLTEGSTCSVKATKTDKKKYYCLKIKKVDQDGNALTGAEFTATRGSTTIDKNSANYSTSNNITTFFTGTDSGAYTITESKIPTGYIGEGSKTAYPRLLIETSSEAAARTECFKDNAAAASGNTIADDTYNDNTNQGCVFTNERKISLINWYKTTENGTTLANGAKFKVKNSSGNYITVSNPVSTVDETNNTKACYQYTGTSSSGTVMESGTTTSGMSMTGEVCVSNLPDGTYTVEEVEPIKYHTFDSTTTKTITAGDTFAGITTSNKFINRPTNFEFTKSVSSGDGSATLNVTKPDGTTGSISLTNLTTQELKKLKFVVTESGSNTPLEFVYVTDHYEYTGNTYDAPSGTRTTILQLNDNRKISITHLEWGKTYEIKEVETDGCIDAGNRTCNGYGYYYPSYSNTSDYQFTVSKTYNSLSTKSLINTPTEITFTKNDLYGYLDVDDIVKFENNEEINAFDKIVFKLKDANGNYLTLQKVKNNGSCNTNGSYAEYRYVPSDASAGSAGTELHTCGGKIKITNLCRETTYKIEEISVPTDSVFIITTPHPEVTYNIPKNTPASGSSSVMQTISDMPTRLVFRKVDAGAQTTPINDNTVRFKVYQCASNVATCTSDNGTLVYFTARGVLTNDTIDSGKEVYKYKGTTNGSGLVSELTPYQGELILRYLPAGYKYTAVETTAPVGYYQAVGDGTETTVSNSSIDNVNTVINDYTEIKFNKADIYNYYKKTDKAKMNDNTIIFDTIKFILRDKNGAQVSLKKIEDGRYKLSQVVSENTTQQLTTKDGSLTITHLNRGEKYYIEEVSADSAGNFTLPTNVTKPSGIPNGWTWAGHPFVEYTVENTKPTSVQTQIINNTPTRIVFVKKDTATGEIINDQNITFNVYSCPKTQSAACTSTNGTLVNFDARGVISGDLEDAGKEVYKYNKLNASGVTDLKLYNGELILRYLPSAEYKYVLVEKTAGDGYYTPTTSIEFTVNQIEVNETALNGILTNVGNVPTEIYFTKNDLYGYAEANSVVKFEDENERNAFDQITFKVKDNNGNYLTFTQVGTCTSNSQYAEYKYSPASSTQGGTELHTCKGKMKITYLNNNSTYKLEEVAVPDNTVFILPTPHPEVTYNIPLNEPQTPPTATISDEPTRIVINKKFKTNDIHEAATGRKQTAEFEVYRCLNTTVPCTYNTSTRRPVRFTPITTIGSEYAYRFALNQSDENNTITKLSLTTTGNKGQIVLRYLPANYRYVVVEKNAPDGYYNIEGELADLDVIVPNNDTSTTYDRINYATKIEFAKDDIYNYFSASDLANAGDVNKIFDSMTFTLRDKDGNVVRLVEVTPGIYRFIQSDGSIPSGNGSTVSLHTKDGKLTITHLYRNEKYYIEETASDTLGNFILPTNVEKPSGIPSGWPWAGHPYKAYDIPNTQSSEILLSDTTPDSLTGTIENKPTRVIFEKRDERTGELIDSESTRFEIYACDSSVTTCTKNNGTKVFFEERTTISGLTNDITAVTPPVLTYKYKKLNANSGVSSLKTDRGVLSIAYLPSKYKYVLVETNAPDGYYEPVNGNEETEFNVESGTVIINSVKRDYEELTEVVINKPTEIIFKKSDLYNYYTSTDVVDSNNNEYLLDTAKFVLRDENGNILTLRKTDTNNDEGNVYRYLQINSSNNIEYINTYKGKLKITNLLRSGTYYIEEVETTEYEQFILPDYMLFDNLPFDNQGHPVVKYIIPNSAPANQTSVTQEIMNIPTRVRFEKRDGKYNYLINDEATTFKVYQCNKDIDCHPSDYSTDEEREAAGIKLINFTARSIITGDGEDDGVEVYKYNKLNAQGVTELHPDKGVLVLRYLPADNNYKYVLFETNAPSKYVLPTGYSAEIEFTVVGTTTSVEEVDIPNAPTALIIRKYADIEGDGVADEGNLLGGAKFKVYKVTNYDPNKKVQDQEKQLISLKTIKDGIYENRPVLDTDVITTCSGESCSYDPDWIGYDSSIWENIDDLIEKSGNDITSVLKEGTALIQYLEYDTYYIIEEVEAPNGYSLPENDDNRFTLVHIEKNATAIADTEDALVNKPSSFTFYKFDNYNTPLDGATFYLQKLDQDKKYNTLTVSKESLENGKVVYKADPNSELTDITTTEGHATVYYLEPGQYRILEVAAPEGYELPKKTINVATFFVDRDGLVYGNNIISNKKPQEVIEYFASDKAELIINIQTGKVVIKYGLIITALIAAIAGLVIFLKKRK